MPKPVQVLSSLPRAFGWIVLAGTSLCTMAAAGPPVEVFSDDFESANLDAWDRLAGASEALTLTLKADGGAAANAVVSLGLPLRPGRLFDPSQVVVQDDLQAEVATHSAALALWPGDGSVRSVLVAFRATLAANEERTFTLTWGLPRTVTAPVLAANPDGPVAATLDPRWYARARATGFQVALADSTAFPGWEAEIEDAFATMSPPWTSYVVSCGSTNLDRTYYDGPHALYQRFTHRGGADAFRRARSEALWYRANALDWYAGNTVALYTCASGWNPSVALDWGVMRRMLGQGMLDDYLVTGDPAALAAVRGLGEAFRQNLTALTTGAEITVKVTERNMAWPMMGLASYYAVDSTAPVLAALQTLVDMTVAWQAEGTSGAFEHDIVRPDPDECGNGPNGASPFMTSLLIDGLMEAQTLTADPDIAPVVVATAQWYQNAAITSDGIAFQYLWNCLDVNYDDSSTADLNLLISHVFGAAFQVSRDPAWLTFGDTMASHGIVNMYAGRPKQWSQSARSFMKYMGYRAQYLAP